MSVDVRTTPTRCKRPYSSLVVCSVDIFEGAGARRGDLHPRPPRPCIVTLPTWVVAPPHSGRSRRLSQLSRVEGHRAAVSGCGRLRSHPPCRLRASRRRRSCRGGHARGRMQSWMHSRVQHYHQYRNRSTRRTLHLMTLRCRTLLRSEISPPLIHSGPISATYLTNRPPPRIPSPPRIPPPAHPLLCDRCSWLRPPRALAR